jgi:hypothetical protein
VISSGVFQELLKEFLNGDIILGKAVLIPSGFDFGVFQSKFGYLLGRAESFSDSSAFDGNVKIPVSSSFVDSSHKNLNQNGTDLAH